MSHGFDITQYGRDGMSARERFVDAMTSNGCCFASNEAEAFLSAVIAEYMAPLVDGVLDHAVRAYRLRDSLLNQREHDATRLVALGEMDGMRTVLCVLRGWDPKHDGDKEGPADEAVLEHWRKKYPEEWT